MTTDLVYIVGGPAANDREDLRYSLRSFATNLQSEPRAVVVVGDPPPWFCGVRIPLTPKAGKFENQRASLTAYVNHPDAADQLVVLNDDMILLEPVDELPIVRGHVQTGLQWHADHRTKSVNAGRCVGDCYQCAVGETAHWTAEQTGEDPPLYEAHAPLPFDTTKLRDVLATYPASRPFAVGEVYPLAGCGGPGVRAGNAKVKQNTADVLAAKLRNPMPYLSSSPASWAGVVGAHVRPMFSEACRWER